MKTAFACAILLGWVATVGCVPASDPSGTPKNAPSATNQAPTATSKARAPDPAVIQKGDAVFQTRCTTCHKRIDAEGPGLMGAPSMQASIPGLSERLSDATYGAKIEQLKVVNPEYYQGKREKIERVLGEDPSRRVETFLRVYLDDPKFDDPKHKMIRPVGITAEEIEAVIPYVLTFQK